MLFFACRAKKRLQKVREGQENQGIGFSLSASLLTHHSLSLLNLVFYYLAIPSTPPRVL